MSPRQESVNKTDDASNNKTDVEDTYTDLSDPELSIDYSEFLLKPPQKIIQIHIVGRWTANFLIIINKKKVSTLWDMGASKFFIKKSCVEKLLITDKIQPCIVVQISSASGSKLQPIGQVKIDISPGMLNQNIHS